MKSFLKDIARGLVIVSFIAVVGYFFGLGLSETFSPVNIIVSSTCDE